MPSSRNLLLVWALIGVAWLVAAPPASAAGKVLTPLKDAASYEADLTSDADGRSWIGTERITVRNAGSGPIDRVWLRLWGNGPVGCAPRAVSVNAITGGTAGRLLRDCTALEVLLPTPLARRGTTAFTLNLSITAPALKDRFGSVDGINLFGNALPVVAQRDSGGWRMPDYSPYGESFVSSWARWTLTLHHPAAVAIAASGTTVTTPDPDPTTSTTRSELHGRDAAWAAGGMAESTRRTARGVLVRAWSIPAAGGNRDDAADAAASALDTLERRLPSYPYPEYDVIVTEIEAGGGMEYPGLVLTDGADDVTRHETGHQWFYGLVGTDQFSEPWVDEGLTSFLEYTWTTGSELSEPQCYRASELPVRNPASFVTSTMSYWNKNVRNYVLAYNNPVCALRAIRQVLGTKRFGRVLRGLVVRHAKGFLTGREVRRAFEQAGGRRVERIWVRWGLDAGPGSS